MNRISEVKEVEDLDMVNRLLKEGWTYISINISRHPTVYILGKLTPCEPE